MAGHEDHFLTKFLSMLWQDSSGRGGSASLSPNAGVAVEPEAEHVQQIEHHLSEIRRLTRTAARHVSKTDVDSLHSAARRGSKADVESLRSMLMSQIDLLLQSGDQGFSTNSRTEPLSTNEPFRKLFERLDVDRDHKLSSDELEEALREVPDLVLSESVKLLEFRERLREKAHAPATYESFCEAIGDLYCRRYRRFCQAAGEAFANALEKSMLQALHSGDLHGEGETFHALKRLGEFGRSPQGPSEEGRSQRANLMLEHSLHCLPQVVSDITKLLEMEEEYRKEQDERADKFAGDVVLCDDWIFQQGLEALVGFPEFASRESILKAIKAEHTEGTHATTSFEAFNDGVKRQTTPEQEWRKIMPEGLMGPVYSLAYDGTPMPSSSHCGEESESQDSSDIMKHPLVNAAGLERYEVIVTRLYTGPMFHQYNSFLRKIGVEFERILKENRKQKGDDEKLAGVEGSGIQNQADMEMTASLTGVRGWAEAEERALKNALKETFNKNGFRVEVEIHERSEVITRRLRVASSLSLHFTVSGYNGEVDALPTYLDGIGQGCLILLQGSEHAYASHGLGGLESVVFWLEKEQHVQNRLRDEETALKEAALRDAKVNAGDFPYATTVHAITSALIKISRVTTIPENGQVFRGIAGRNVAARFLRPTRFGSRVGDELGFMSTSTRKDTAVGYIQSDKRNKQMFEIKVGNIDRGADISFLSLFPGEQEMLFPPNSCLEVIGSARYEFSSKGVLMVWPLRLNVNLKGRTIEEFKGMRKNLLVEAAHNVTFSVNDFLKQQLSSASSHDGTSMDFKQAVRKAEAARLACEHEVAGLTEWEEEEYNQDAVYAMAYEQLTDIKPFVKLLFGPQVDENQAEVVVTTELPRFTARQLLVKYTRKLISDPELPPADMRTHSRELCRLSKLFQSHIEELDEKACTPLLRWTKEGYWQETGMLLNAGADADAVDAEGNSALHLAAIYNNQHVVAIFATRARASKEWAERRTVEDCDTNKINAAGNTPLLEAAIHGRLDLTGALLEFGAEVNFQRKGDGKTALYLAAEKGHGGVLQELLKFGAKIELTSNKGTTALLAAAEAGSEEAFDALMRGGADMDWDTQLPQRVLERLDVFALLFKDAYYNKLLDFAEKPEFKAGLLQASGQSTYLTKLEAEFAKAETPDRKKAALDNFVKVARYLMDVGAPEHLAAAYGVMLSGLDNTDGGQEIYGAMDKVAIAKVKMLGLLNELYGRKRYSPPRQGFNSVSECIKVLGEARKMLERLSALSDDDTLKDELTLEEATVFEHTGYLYLYSKERVLAEQRKSSETTEEEYTAEYWFQKEIAALYPFQALGLPNPLAGTEAQEEPGFRREVLEDMPKARIRKLTDALNALGTAYEMKLKVDKPENKQENMAYKLALVSYRLSVEVGTDCGANHEDVARSLMSRGNFSVYVGEKLAAKSDLQESVRMFEMSLGKKHPRTVGARNALAKFLSRFEVFAGLCSEGGHAEVLDLAKSVPEFKQLLIKDGQCVYLADLEAAFQRAEPREKKAALDNLTRVAQFLVNIAGPDFLAAGHATLLKAMELAQTEIETSGEPSVKLAKVKMLGGLNELYGRKRCTPTADFKAVERQKDVLKEARKLLEDAAALKEDEQHKDDMILEEAIVLEGTGYLYLFNKDKVMSDADKERQRFGEYWFKREITVLYPEEWDVDGSLSFDNAKVKTLKKARVRKLTDALNALGTAYEMKLKGAAKDSAVPISELEWFTKAHLAYTKSIEVAELSANQADLARSYMSRGNLLRFAGEKEGAVQDLEKCVRKFRDALGDSHPRTKAADTALSNLLTQLDFFMWATNQHGQTRMLELAKGNAEFNLRLVGIDPMLELAKGNAEFNLRLVGIDPPDMKTRCCYLDALEKQFETAATPSAKKEVLENFVKVAWFLMDLGGPACLEAAYRVLRSGVDFAQGAISDAEVKAGKVKILAVLNELHGRKKYQPVVDFNAIEEQRQVLDEARTLLDQTASLKESEAYKEDLILDEAMVLEGTGYLYLFNKDKVMSEEDKAKQFFGEYWFKREITVLYPEEWDVDGSLSFDNAKVQTLNNARVRKLADALNALGTAYEIKLKGAAKDSKVQLSEHEFFTKALEAYDKSVELAKSCGCVADLARSHMSRGNLYKYANLKEKALTDLEKSVELFQDALGEGHTRTKSARRPLEELRSIMAPKLPDTPRAASVPRK